MRARLLASCVVLAALSAPNAHATDTWTTPHPGVRHLYRTASGPLRIHALVVDLCQPGVSLRATAASERQRTPSSFGALVGAEAVINGDFFSYGTYFPIGLAKGNGAAWAGTGDSAWQALVAFGPHRAAFSADSEVFSAATAHTEIVSGYAQIVRAGTAITSYDCSGHFCARHPRTAVGLSEDRRTLYLMVIDGRTSLSVGVTLADLAAQMRSIGAWDAVNLDGGGSTAMWVKDLGVVNAPSDGSQRPVSNHLAVHADGAGQPGSCATWGPTQAALDAPRFDAAGSTDLDGDGLGDVCARAAAGLRCRLSGTTALTSGPSGPDPELGDSLGWDNPEYYTTFHFGDVTGDGLADLCARGAAGIYCYRSTGAGFATPAIIGPAWSNAAGWNQPKYYSTIRMADLNGDGKADLCGRGPDGVHCHIANGTGFGPDVGGPELSDAVGWGAVQHYGTLRTGDLDGDGRHDLCARAGAGVVCWRSNGTKWATYMATTFWGNAAGYADVAYWGTFELVDVTGDGKDDVCIRGPEGVLCRPSTGTGFGAEIAGPTLSDASGWYDPSNHLAMRWGDLDGDGKADLCARANAGIRCWRSLGASFGATITGPELSDASGWFRDRYWATLRMGDVNGDGKADVCGRDADRFRCWLSTGSGFGAVWSGGPTWADSVGWGDVKYWGALHLATPRAGVADPCSLATACAAGAVQAEPCGGCGQRVRSCSAECSWSAWGAGAGAGGAAACDDHDPCTDDTCSAGGACGHAFNQASCDDGDACTVGDRCQGGACGGSPRDCDDGAPCTLDACAPATGCTHTAHAGACDDGDTCTVGEGCEGGVCVGGAPRACDDGDACTSDACDPAQGCVHAAIAGACDDGDACTVADSCVGGACAGVAVSCNDMNPCTSDACDPALGCVNPPRAGTCDDGDACTTDDACQAGTCAGAPLAAGACDDGDPCTSDRCDPASGCAHAASDAPCDDGDPCTEGDHCAGGACVGAASACDDGNPCTADLCEPTTLGCTHTPMADGPCDDGDPCTSATCVGGVCEVGWVDPGCCSGDDACPARIERCDPGTGRCAPVQCSTCASAADCGTGNRCELLGERAVCTVDCSQIGATCPAGARCEAAADGGSRCVPTGGVCPCPVGDPGCAACDPADPGCGAQVPGGAASGCEGGGAGGGALALLAIAALAGLALRRRRARCGRR